MNYIFMVSIVIGVVIIIYNLIRRLHSKVRLVESNPPKRVEVKKEITELERLIKEHEEIKEITS